jgi:hypothetical protein
MRWQRLDVPGTDRCTLAALSPGWRLEGSAVFADPDGDARLEYVVSADGDWRTVSGAVHGTIRNRRVALDIERTQDGHWRVNGQPMPELEGLVDLDLGFTPATNLFPLRRLALGVGEGAEAAAAWLDEERWVIRRLPQRYERRADDAWWYESPDSGYAGLLRVNADGFITDYPGLWRAEPG